MANSIMAERLAARVQQQRMAARAASTRELLEVVKSECVPTGRIEGLVATGGAVATGTLLGSTVPITGISACDIILWTGAVTGAGMLTRSVVKASVEWKELGTRLVRKIRKPSEEKLVAEAQMAKLNKEFAQKMAVLAEMQKSVK